MRPALSVLAIVVAIASQGCSSDPVAVDPMLVTGKWGMSFSVPGGFFDMTLLASGTEVTGSSNGCGEAGPCSTAVINGTSDETGVHLTIVTSITLPQPSGPFTSVFDGKLVNANTLRGTLEDVGSSQVSGASGVVTFHRE